MAMTMTQKILSAHCGGKKLKAGELIMAKLDLVLGNDITTPVAIKEMERVCCQKVYDTCKIALVMDHFTPNKDIKSAEQVKSVREFVKKTGVVNFFDVGEMGVEHALLPEKGLVVSGDLVIGADSHTCTYGALGAFSTGVGSTDMAYGMMNGEAWFKVPEAIKVNLSGKLNKFVGGKDVILHLIGMIGVDGALYKSLEFVGDGIKCLSMDDRFTICNMAIEAGAKNGIFPVDDKTLDYIAAHSDKKPVIFNADPDASYCQTIDIDLNTIEPCVAFPHLPSNVKTFAKIGDIAIDQVVIGSCTNGRLSDFVVAADILRGKRIANGIRAIVIPSTKKIYLDMLEMGLIRDFIEAGCIVSTPTCGPCLGGHMGILAKGERCVATTNRNFVGRMGHSESEVYLAGPAVAAASALTGKLTSPKEV